MGLNKKFEGQGSWLSKVTSPKIQRLERNINVGELDYNPRNFEVVKNSSPHIEPTPISYTFDTKEELQTGVNLWVSNNSSALETYGDINTWTFAPTITDMSELFANKITFNSDISNWDVSSVSDMSQMFYNATAFNQPIGSWDVSNIINMGLMFAGASSFNQDIGDWDVSNVTTMFGTFNSTPFNQNISSWNVSNVTNMDSMFSQATSFNQPIGSWNVSNVINMDNMFEGATVFNQNLTGWCVTNINSEPTQFSPGSALTELNKPVWGTCPS
jgi:surface protein